MFGENIVIFTQSGTTKDDMGEVISAWRTEMVADVLVRPRGALDGSDRIGSVQVKYTLALPKEYTANMPSLANGRVALIDRGMDANNPDAALHIIGEPDITKPCPTRWNCSVEVGRIDG